MKYECSIGKYEDGVHLALKTHAYPIMLLLCIRKKLTVAGSVGDCANKRKNFEKNWKKQLTFP